MPNFHEFTALWKREKSKDQVDLDRIIRGDSEDGFLPGYNKGRLTIDLESVVAFNEGDDSDVEDGFNHTVVEVSGGERYRIEMKYDDFKAAIVYHLKTKIKP